MRTVTNQDIGDLDSGLIDVDPEYQREVVWTGECDQRAPVDNLASCKPNIYVQLTV